MLNTSLIRVTRRDLINQVPGLRDALLAKSFLVSADRSQGEQRATAKKYAELYAHDAQQAGFTGSVEEHEQRINEILQSTPGIAS
jgi:hypothetical protein